MAEVNTPRLLAAAKEFNIGTGTLTDFLVSKGFDTDELKPTSKISEEMYRVLQVEFQPDKVAKQKAEQIDLPKNAPSENKRRRDEQDLSFTKKEVKIEAKAKEEAVPVVVPEVEEATPEPVVVEEVKEEKAPEKPAEEVVVNEPVREPEVVETPVVETPPVIEEPAQPEITKIEAPVSGLKVIDKIDLSTIDSSVRPKKDAKKKENRPENKPQPKPEPQAEEKPKIKGVIQKEPEPVKEEPKVAGPVVEPVKDVPAIITNIKAAKLEGPKIMGKIDLPLNNDTRPRPSDERRKRKRIIVEKKPGGHPQQGGNFQRPPGNMPQRPHGPNRPAAPGAGGRFNRNAPQVRREEKEIDQKEIQDKIKETQAKLAGSGGRGKSLKAKYRKQNAKRQLKMWVNKQRTINFRLRNLFL